MAESHTNRNSSNQLSKEIKGSSASTSEVYEKNIEEEANSYYRQLFSDRLTHDAMIQMLARYKESPEIREQQLFDCMLANLFEEYKFFNRYPEKQLKIAADLFGLFIKHQLVTHLTLGIALRAVLDALRKPPDSKMFTFGTRALEKFLERTVEWPQYSRHILQISHLRSTHLEIVNAIEKLLEDNGYCEPLPHPYTNISLPF